MAAAQTTSWFSAAIKPARPGWYEVRENKPLHHRSKGKLLGRPFRYWDGKDWLTDEPASGWGWLSIFGNHEAHEWRGLADPHDTRRPGIGRIVDELATSRPNTSLQQLDAVAKMIWHDRNPKAAA